MANETRAEVKNLHSSLGSGRILTAVANHELEGAEIITYLCIPAAEAREFLLEVIGAVGALIRNCELEFGVAPIYLIELRAKARALLAKLEEE